MSTFCVFGIKHSDCVEKARKAMPTMIGREVISRERWAMYCDLLADHIYQQSARETQISPAFDASQFAIDWINTAKRTGQIAQARVMAKGEKFDAKGAPVLRKGKPVIGWVEYKSAAV